MNNEKPIAVIGLGYVGLPIAIAFGETRPVIGFDTDQRRIADLSVGVDSTMEVSEQQIKNAHYLEFTSKSSAISKAKIFIVTVPTPIDDNNVPDPHNAS